MNSPEPLAIVGIGCRMPGGANSPEGFWRLLDGGLDAIRDVPPDRWHWPSVFHPDPGRSGKLYVRRGGFIDGVDLFDAAFFNISRREAEWADPQQRLLLEVAYESLEDAGLPLEALAGSRTGVFVGVCTYDYGAMHGRLSERSEIDAYTSLGSALCVSANRLSYFFDLRGPSMAVDTACSSSLVATHLACRSIWAGESDMAMVGGVSVLIQPEGTIGFCQAKMLAPDGRCKSFDAAADGYVRAEGVGVMVLKRLPRALLDNDRIYAVIRAAAVNQDGRTPGITVPSETAQAAMLTEVYRQAGIPARSVQYIEAHGTGTSVGDPIEARALGRALSEGRPPHEPCLIGSVKSNVGHLEAASGIAGVIKAALSIHHGRIPATLHLTQPNPAIPFDELNMSVVRESRPWPQNGHAERIAGVNSFGFGGTNAHVVLASPPEAPGRVGEPWSEGRALAVPISARNPSALSALARSLATRLTENLAEPVSLADVAHTMAARRTHHEFRTAITASTAAEFAERAAAFADEPGEIESVAPDAPRRLVFVFSGMGPQWWGMGRQLCVEEPVFRQAIEACDQALRAYVPWSLINELARDEASSRVHDTCIAQPAIFAIQVALSRLWGSWGVRADAVLGHSLGEVAAAHYAGVLSLEDAIALVYHRSRLQSLTAGEGRMLSVAMPIGDVEGIVARFDGRVSIAAYNSPESATLSGDSGALQQIADELTDREVFNRFLKVDVPYHSRAMDRLQAELLQSLQALAAHLATTEIISTLTGQSVRGDDMTADYWWRSMRHAVRFHEAVQTVTRDDRTVFLEIGPHPVLSASLSECVAAAGFQATSLASLRRSEPERATLLACVGRLYACGFPVQWKLVNGDVGRFVSLPRYPWQHERYWHETARAARERIGQPVRPLLGSPGDAARTSWTTDLSGFHLAFLDDHQVDQHTVFPAAGFLEMALEAAAEQYPQPAYVIEELALEKPMLLPAEGRPIAQLVLGERTSDFEIFSRGRANGSPWERHAVGKMHHLAADAAPPRRSLQDIRQRCVQHVAQDDCYRHFESRGLRYGPCFRGIRQLWSGDGEALARIELGDADDRDGFLAHPGVVDSCFQALMGAMLADTAGGASSDGLFLPVRIARAVVREPVGSRVWSHARLVRREDRSIVGDIDLLSDEGDVLVEIRGFTCRQVDRPEPALAGGFFQYRWIRDMSKGSPLARRADDLPSPGELLGRLRAMGDNEFWRRGLQTSDQSPAINELSRAYVFEAFARMGWRPRLGERFTVADLMGRLKVVAVHRPLLHRVLVSLAADGFVRQTNGDWTVLREFSASSSGDVWKSLWDGFPCDLAELTLLRRCGEGLDAVLRGEVAGLELIFPGGSTATLEHVYQDSPSCRSCNRVVQKAVAAAFDRLPAGRELRILEIGGGTGGMTAHVLPELPARGARYVFTDVGPLLLSQAEQRFGRFPNTEFRPLDVEKNPLDQGFEAHGFDLVLASDVLHATVDLAATLENVKRLMASHGLLVILEGKLAPSPLWSTLVFGLLKEWWLFTDTDVRGDDPWISAESWRQVLSASGFLETTDLTADLQTDDSINAVLVARAPALAEGDDGPVERSAAPEQATWMILSDGGAVAADLARRLQGAGHTVLTVVRGDSAQNHEKGTLAIRPLDRGEMRRAIGLALDASPPLAGIVHLWSLGIPAAAVAEPAAVRAARAEALAGALHAVQCIQEVGPASAPRLLLVTRGAESVESPTGDADPDQATLWGLGRVIMTECPQVRCRLVDLESAVADGGAVFAESMNTDAEQETAWRGGVRHLHRYESIAPTEVAPAAARATAQQAFAITSPPGGSLDRLQFKPDARMAPRPGQVEIEVHASGLNFKDVMLAMGLLPDDALEGGFTGRNLGMECAGRIVAVGEGVRGLKVGDRVMACGPGTLRSHLTLDAQFVAPVPADLSDEDAATVLIAYLTAYYGLVDVARLARGERVLIHAATGGVGLAAVQLAQHIGAEIYATAGSDDKRQLLRALGVPHVLNSRTLAFADEILRLTAGQGVDVVLNSLAGDAIPKSLAVLKPYGRFVEIGKRDVYEDSKVGLRPFRNNLSLFVLDLDRVCAQRPDLALAPFGCVTRLLADRTVRPLPHRVFPADRIQDAFRYMAQAKHIGKVVVSMRTPPSSLAPTAPAPLRFRQDGAYLITGGLGGFGLRLAGWLARHGAGHIAMVSRRGAADDDARQAIDAVQRAGASVSLFQGDVSDESDVRRVLAEMAAALPPLRGVFHAAMVLDDAPLHDLTLERFDRVMAPKVEGAWNLHRLTHGLPIEHFVLFSSMASQVGNPGQANYAAANTYLDALARHRRAAGLPGLTVNWGAVADVGYVAMNPEVARRLDANGVRPLPADQLLAMLAVLMQRGAVQAGAGQLDWFRLTNMLGLGQSTRFAHLAVRHEAEEGAEAGAFDLDAILRAEPAARVEMLQNRLRERLARVLGAAPSRLDVNQSLVNLGMDSLMAVEVRNRIRTELEVDVPPAKFMEGISLRGLAVFVLERLAELHAARFKGAVTSQASTSPTAGATAPQPPREPEPAVAVDSLSDDEVNAQLRRLLTVGRAP